MFLRDDILPITTLGCPLEHGTERVCTRMRICLHSGVLPSHATLLSKPSGMLQDKHGGGHSPSVDGPLLGLMNQPMPAPLWPRPTDLTPLVCQATELPAKSQTASHALSQSVTSQPPAGVETTGMWQCTVCRHSHAPYNPQSSQTSCQLLTGTLHGQRLGCPV